jgi:hypothetical protein
MIDQTATSRQIGPGHQVKQTGLKEGAPSHDRAVVRATSWEPWDDMDIAEWIIQGRRLGSIGRAVSWWIGDWVNYGNTRFGEKYSRAARITGYDVQSLMNMAYVAARFSCTRRREGLSWSHHAEVAGLEADVQETWLDRAEKTRLSVHGLRDELRTWRAQLWKADESSQPDSRPGSQTGCADEHVVCPQCGFKIASKESLASRSRTLGSNSPGAGRM